MSATPGPTTPVQRLREGRHIINSQKNKFLLCALWNSKNKINFQWQGGDKGEDIEEEDGYSF